MIPTCQIEYVSSNSADGLPWGRASVAECADCGKVLCEKCRTECCGDSYCWQCYDYHVARTCIRKPIRGERRIHERTGTA
jgi:hypothetical protein